MERINHLANWKLINYLEERYYSWGSWLGRAFTEEQTTLSSTVNCFFLAWSDDMNMIIQKIESQEFYWYNQFYRHWDIISSCCLKSFSHTLRMAVCITSVKEKMPTGWKSCSLSTTYKWCSRVAVNNEIACANVLRPKHAITGCRTCLRVSGAEWVRLHTSICSDRKCFRKVATGICKPAILGDFRKSWRNMLVLNTRTNMMEIPWHHDSKRFQSIDADCSPLQHR